MNMKKTMLASAAPIVVAMVCAGTIAHAQEAENSAALGEIIVTAQKRSENIQNVPLSIQAVTGDELAAAGVTNPTALARVAPSVKISNTGLLDASLAIRIRGFGTPSNSSADSDVAPYVDGVFIPRPGSIVKSFLDVSSIEILNGPQGTLFGRNAAMGAISITSNAPRYEQSLSASAEVSSFDTIAATLIGNTALSETTAVRLALRYYHTDGMYKNNLDGHTYGGRSDYIGRLSFRADLSPDIDWTLRLDGSRSSGDATQPQGVYMGTATQASITNLTNALAARGAPPPVFSSRPSFHFNQQFTDNDLYDRQYGISSDLNWSLNPKLALRMINSYRDWKNVQGIGDTIATALDLLSVDSAFRSKSTSHELQFISPRDAFLDGKLGFTAGIYYFHENYDHDTTFNLQSQFCSNISIIFGLDTACAAGPQQGAGTLVFDQKTSSFALYGQLNYNLLSNVSIDLGARQTWDKKNTIFQSVIPNPAAMLPIAVAEGPYNIKLKEDKPSFRASISWNLTPDVMAFGTFSTGYKSGGVTNAGSGFAPLSDLSQRQFESESVEDFEAGIKSTFWDRRAQVNVSLFTTRLKDFQDRSFNGVNFVIRNSGSVRSKGIDFDSKFRPMPGLTLRLGATYLDAKYISNTAAPGLEGCGGTPACPSVQDLSGERLQFSPKLQANAGLEWSFDVFNGNTGTIGINEHHTSSYLTSNTNNPASRLPGYWITDVSASLAGEGDKWKVEVFSTNVFNKHYYTDTLPQVLGGLFGATDPATGYTLYRGIIADPRRVGVRFSANF